MGSFTYAEVLWAPSGGRGGGQYDETDAKKSNRLFSFTATRPSRRPLAALTTPEAHAASGESKAAVILSRLHPGGVHPANHTVVTADD